MTPYCFNERNGKKLYKERINIDTSSYGRE